MAGFLEGLGQADPALGGAVNTLSQGQDLGSLLKAAGQAVGGSIEDFPKMLASFSPLGQATSAINSVGSFKANPAEVLLGIAGAGMATLGGIAAWHNYQENGGVRDETGAIFGRPNEERALNQLYNEPNEPGVNARNSFRVNDMLRNANDPEALARSLGTGTTQDFDGRLTQHYGFVNGLAQQIVQNVPQHAQYVAQSQDPMAATTRAAAYEMAKFDSAVEQGLIKDKKIVATYHKFTDDPTTVKPDDMAALQQYMVNLAKDTTWVQHPMWAVHPMLKLQGIKASDNGGFDYTWKTVPALDNGALDTKAVRTRTLYNLDYRAVVPQMVDNIMRVIHLADPDTWGGNSPPNNGIDFYPKAKADIAATAKDLPTPVPGVPFSSLHPDTGAAITALLSAAEPWSSNVSKMAAVTGGASHQDLIGPQYGLMVSGNDYNKVQDLLPHGGQYLGGDIGEEQYGEDQPPARAPLDVVLNKSPEAAMRAQKQMMFFTNITHPEAWMPVTVDRHAFDIALGFDTGVDKRPLDKIFKRNGQVVDDVYGTVAQAYRMAAIESGLTPSQVQALTWDAWKKMKTAHDTDPETGKTKRGGWGRPNGPLVLDSTILQMMRDGLNEEQARQVQGLPAALVTGADEPRFEVAGDGVGVRAEPTTDNRTQFRVLHAGGDPHSNNARTVPFLTVEHRPLFDGPGYERQVVGSAAPLATGSVPAMTFDHWADPQLPAHPALANGNNLLVTAPLADNGGAALGALEAHLRHYLKLNDATYLMGPARTVVDVRGEKLQPADFNGMNADDLSDYFANERWAAISAKTSQGAGNHQALGEDIRNLGYHPIDQMGSYGGEEEPSWLVPGMSPGEAMKLGRDYGQESVATPHGVLWSNGRQMVRSTGGYHVWEAGSTPPPGADPENFSEFHLGDKTYRFSMSTNDDDWENGPPVPDSIDMAQPTTRQQARRSVLVRLGDHPTATQLQAVWDAVQQVRDETGADLEPKLYLQGGATAPAGSHQVVEAVHRAGPVYMSHMASNLDVKTSHVVPVYVTKDMADNVTDNDMVKAVTPAKYEQGQVPADAIANGHVRLFFGHLLETEGPQGKQPALAEDVMKSRLPGGTPRHVAVYIPQDDSVMPAVSFGVHSQADAALGLRQAQPDQSRVTFGHVEGPTLVLQSPDPLQYERTVQTLRRLGVSGPIKAQKAVAVNG